MPNPGDTIRTSITTLINGIDYESTGEDFTWDFSNLTVLAQTVDTFRSTQETPLAFQLFFLQSNLALQYLDFDLVPNINIEDAYRYFKESDNDFRELGFGVRLNGIPVPVTFDQSDIIYRFPMDYGNEDSSFSEFGLSLPGLGYAGSERKRNNIVDGWGTLKTPYGTFETLRIRTDIYEKDTIFLDSAGTGFPLVREITEYKWLAKDMGLPVLQVNEEGIIVTATYIDSVRTSFTGVADPVATDYDLVIYPNPCRDYLSINYELKDNEDVEITLLSMFGNEITRVHIEHQPPGNYSRIVNLEALGIKPGFYVVKFLTRDKRVVRRIIKR